MKLEDISESEENIYYFMKNGLNLMIKKINEQIETIIEEFYEEMNTEKYYLILLIVVMIIIYSICYIIFIIFYQKVEIKKLNYLSIFDDIGKDYIFLSLEKCELFSQKLYLKDESFGTQNDNLSNNASMKDNYIMGNHNLSPRKNITKINEIKQPVSSRKESTKKKFFSKSKFSGFVIILILLLVQIFSYCYYNQRLKIYKKCVQYQYYNNQYYSLFLFPFIAVREYICNSNSTISEILLPFESLLVGM